MRRLRPAHSLMAVAVASALPLLLVASFPAQLHRLVPSGAYVVFHNVAEFFSIMVSLSVFGVGWYAFDQSKDRHALFLGAAFLATGLLDFMHAMGNAAMPAFITANSTNKSTQFWIAARVVDASALFASAFIYPDRPLRVLTKWNLLCLALATVALVFLGVTFFPSVVPATFVPGTGLTRFKVGAEYLVIGFYFLGLIAYGSRLRRTGDGALLVYMAAFLVAIGSEAAFASYKTAFDTYNVLGHVYKVIAFYLIYRGAFAGAVARPYRQLSDLNTELERRVAERTARLASANRELEESREWLQVTLSSIGDAVLTCDAERRVTFMNPVAAELTGWPASEALGVPIARVFATIDEESRRPGEDIVERVLRDCRAAALANHTALLTRDGREIPIEDSAAPIRSGDGAPSGVVVVFHHVAEKRRAEAALRRSEAEARARAAELETILNCVADGVIVYDREGRTLRSTPAADQIVGIPLEERRAPVQDRVLRQYQIFDEDGRQLGRDEMVAVRAAVHGEAVKGAIAEVRPASGAARWLSMNATPLFLDGEHAGAVVSLSDITHRKIAEQELRRTEQALREANDQLRGAARRKDEFLAMLSHELRNPLAPIRNSTYILQHAEPGTEQARRAQDVIARQTEHLARLVDDLLDVTRIARGKIELHTTRVDAREVVRRACDDYRTLFHARGLRLDVRTSSPVWIDADETRLAQVVGNLLQNAAKFSRAGGSVDVSVEVGGTFGEIRVRDEGCGIAPDLLPRVFEPFVQAEAGLARTRGGLGLGLALVKGLVELHGGSVRGRSEGPGRGSEFVLSLPLKTPPQQAARPADGDTAARSFTVLVIEDNVDAAQSIAEVLEMEGHRVHVATDGLSGVAKAREVRPDVVLCDVGLPDVDGYDVARTLRADKGSGPLRLIALSGYALAEDRRRAREAGFDDHVAKPPSLEVLLASVARAAGP